MNIVEKTRIIAVCVLTIICIFTDIKSYRVSNKCLGIFIVMAIGLMVVDYKDAIGYLLGTIFPLVILWPVYKLKGLGAGDVKMLGVLGAFLGASRIMKIIWISLVAGGIMAAGKIIFMGVDMYRLRMNLLEIKSAAKISDVKKELRIHYTIAIGIGVIVALM